MIASLILGICIGWFLGIATVAGVAVWACRKIWIPA
jgi:hypothetical protein